MVKDIKNYEGLYSISDDGMCFSYRSNRYLKPQRFSGKKYWYYTLCKDGARTKYKIHRLVAEAFIPNPLGLPQVNHKDEDPSNNKVNNLEWCNANYNVNYGTRNKKTSEKMLGNRNAPMKKVEQLTLNGEVIKEWESISEASRALHLQTSGITRACQGKINSSGGYKWRYLNNAQIRYK